MKTVICPPAVSIPTERGNVEQNALGLLRCVITEDSGLDSSMEDDGLVRVDRLVRLRCH